MPIYEFACPSCRRIFPFWGKVSDRSQRPTCPRCGRRNLGRVPSLFAIASGGEGQGGEGFSGQVGGEGLGSGGGGEFLEGLSPGQQARMERELGSLMAKAEHLDESNPQEMGAFMRRMAEVAGLPQSSAMEEAIRRMEAGEDPERIEEDLGDVLGGQEGEGGGDPGGGGLGGYSRDEGMYDF